MASRAYNGGDATDLILTPIFKKDGGGSGRCLVGLGREPRNGQMHLGSLPQLQTVASLDEAIIWLNWQLDLIWQQGDALRVGDQLFPDLIQGMKAFVAGNSETGSLSSSASDQLNATRPPSRVSGAVDGEAVEKNGSHTR